MTQKKDPRQTLAVVIDDHYILMPSACNPMVSPPGINLHNSCPREPDSNSQQRER